jgi:multiple sugar transport system substrate-binding protein
MNRCTDQKDWLLPFAKTMVRGNVYGLQQDYRIPILIYRKKVLDEGKVTPPRTWDDVCVAGAKLTKGTVAGYAIPIGTTGGIGGAQAFGELHLSTLLSGSDGKYFADDNRTIAFSKESFIRPQVKDQFVKCKSTPMASLQYGYNEVHDGLRSGTVRWRRSGSFAIARSRRRSG